MSRGKQKNTSESYRMVQHRCAAAILVVEPDIHRLVLETLEPLPQDRKCFRMINGVLVERTVKDVVPSLKTNSDGLRKVLEDLVKQYQSLQGEMEKWKVHKLALLEHHYSAEANDRL